MPHHQLFRTRHVWRTAVISTKCDPYSNAGIKPKDKVRLEQTQIVSLYTFCSFVAHLLIPMACFGSKQRLKKMLGVAAVFDLVNSSSSWFHRYSNYFSVPILPLSLYVVLEKLLQGIRWMSSNWNGFPVCNAHDPKLSPFQSNMRLARAPPSFSSLEEDFELPRVSFLGHFCS